MKKRKSRWSFLKRVVVSFLGGGVALLFYGVGFAAASDPLEAIVKPEVKALFGPTSTVAFIIYVCEVLSGCVAYIKTKNPLILIGTPVVVTFTTAAFSYISK